MSPREKPFTVMQVVGGLRQDGVGRGTLEIDNALVEHGWGSVVVSAGGRLVHQVRGRHVEVRLSGKKLGKRAMGAWRLRKIIEENGVDLVHARNRSPAWVARLAARWAGKPFITSFHGAWDAADPKVKWFSSIMTKGERVIAVSDFVAKRLVADYGVDPARVTVILRGADIGHFKPDAPKAALDLPAGRPVVMLPGRIAHWKGQHVFVEAMRGLDATGVLVGDVTDRTYLESFLGGMPDNVLILPATTDMPGVLAHADIVVSASTSPEAFGRVAVEGQAMGRPVVATNIGGALETVIPGETGRLVPPGDSAAMGQAIRELLDELQTDPNRYRDACLENAHRLSTAHMCEKELALYEEVLRGRG